MKLINFGSFLYNCYSLKNILQALPHTCLKTFQAIRKFLGNLLIASVKKLPETPITFSHKCSLIIFNEHLPTYLKCFGMKIILSYTYVGMYLQQQANTKS